ncbi:MAG: lysophospholipid acyltransferase family protein [Parahaliea sp.]
MDHVKALLVKGLLHTSSMLPLEGVRAMGRSIAHLSWLANSSARRVTERNIALVYPELSAAEREQLARNSLAATAELAAEMGHIWTRGWDWTCRHILQVHGEELVYKAKAQGRGVIVLAPHLGNWEIAGLYLATLGPTVALYEPPQLAALDELIRNGRQASGSTLVPTDSRGLARLLKSVRKGHFSGILPDQCPRDVNSGLNSEFMGIRCFTGTLASNMIRRTGAIALFSVAFRVRGGWELCYLPAEDAIYDEDTAISVAALNRGVAACVARHPEQYQWEYKRFKVRPKEGPGVYADL